MSCFCEGFVVWNGGEKTLVFPAFREKQHRNIFSHHTGRLTKFGWILTYLKISLTRLLPGAILLVAACNPFSRCFCMRKSWSETQVILLKLALPGEIISRLSLSYTHPWGQSLIVMQVTSAAIFLWWPNHPQWF